MPWPTDWAIAEDCENVLLETNPAKPYSVTIWGVGDEQNFYVAAGKQSSRWAQNIETVSYTHLTLPTNREV